MTITELRKLLEQYEGVGMGDRLIIVAKDNELKTYSPLTEVVDGNYEKVSDKQGNFTFDPDGEDAGGCDSIWLAGNW